VLIIVIGDIRGMAATLRNNLGQIDVWLHENARNEPHQFIFLAEATEGHMRSVSAGRPTPPIHRRYLPSRQ
jgi:hypothetical protein